VPTVVKADTILTTVTDVFRARGVPAEEARIVAEHLVDGEACGVSSHGLIRVTQYVQAIADRQVNPTAKLAVRSEAGCTAALDGQHGFGQVMALRAIDVAIGMARRGGVAAVTLTNCGHTGRLGSYTERAARQGFAAMMMVNSGGHGQRVAPFGGVAGRLSTNPLSIAVPSGSDHPIVLDIATSVAPEGRVRALLTSGQRMPPGWVITASGEQTTNPADLYGPPAGALLPSGGHKGFGLAFLIDALAGGLSAAGCCSPDSASRPASDGVLFVVINVSAFRPLVDFEGELRALSAHIHATPTAPGVSAILTPGELEATTRRQRLRDGIPVEASIWEAIQKLVG
jgi:uncharacterized oxidoreductase